MYYWPEFPGRGEFMRLIWEETNTSYHDILHHMTFKQAMQYCYDLGYGQGQLFGERFFAVPVVIHQYSHNDERSSSISSTSASTTNVEKKTRVLSQTPTIIPYVAKHTANGQLYPKNEDDVYRAEILLHCLLDWVVEGEFYWHPIDKNKGYLEQKEQAASFVQYFKEKRLIKWLTYFEQRLKDNGGEYLIGQDMTYIDLCLFHVLCGMEYECSKEFHTLSTIPLLKLFQQRIAQRPNIARYLSSDRRFAFTGTGPIF